MRPSRRTWRIRGLPCDVDRLQLARSLRHHSDLRWPNGDGVRDYDNRGKDVVIHTLAPDLRVDYQVATVRFQDLPSQLQELGPRNELNIKIKTKSEGPASEVLIDEHFDGITTLFSPVTDEEHQIDILAVSGLGSHPFGSFVNKKDGNMWLTSNLPRDMPAARVMIFGYESKLQDSRSHIELDDLAGPVHIAMSQILQSKRRPLLVIGHSLGGLLVKDALIRSMEPGFETGLPNFLDLIAGIILFGTPNDGLDIESLVPMVNDQPNRSLLESLRSTGSQMLSRQRKDFSKVLERTKLQLFCLYETELSPTAAQDQTTREWKMGGELRFLVSKSSATSCLPAGAPSTRSVSIRRNHSDLVKFSIHDAEYDKVSFILNQIQAMETRHRTQESDFQCPQATREPQNGNWVTGQQKRPAGDIQVHQSVKRPVNDALSTSGGKRPRLASCLLENGEAQAKDDPAARDQASEEMRTLKEELIRQLYFSKIDERLTHLAPAQANTCRWFLTESKYQSWQDVARQSEHGGFLWIKGHPGSGKSTLMKYLFQETKDKSRNDPSRITLSFFFLARGTTEEKTTSGLYRSLLHQLFEVAPELKDSLQWITPDGARTIQRNGWSEEALKQSLKCAVPKLRHRSLTMFVDALDECDEDKANDMVSFFEELCECAAEARVKLQICFSSRHYPTVVINKGLEVNLEEEIGHGEDIRKYVYSKLKLKSKSKHTEAFRSEILEKSSGIFLWVVLVLDILNKEKSMSIQKIREHLKKIPPGLDDLFQMILDRDGENLEQLKICLNWILFARRALKPQELYFAVQLGFDKECSGFWDEEDLVLDDMRAFVRSCSKGLAEVTRNATSEVQFIHESVRDFLLGKYGNQWSGTSENLQGHGHQVLRDCCLAQVTAPISRQIEIPDPLPPASKKWSQAGELRDNIGLKFPFLKYSVDNVFYHANLAQRNGMDQQPFISDFPLQRWILFNNVFERHEIRRYTPSASLLYIFGEKNLGDLISIHPLRDSCFQYESERHGTPIFAALVHNSHNAVQAFLAAQAANEPPTSPLHELSVQYEQHRTKPTKLGIDYTFRRRTGFRLLEDLVQNDEEAATVAFILSPRGDNRLSHLSYIETSRLLRLATKQGHEALSRLLLQNRAHMDVAEDDHLSGTLLLEAASHGHGAIVKLLLNRGADIETSKLKPFTPLSYAARDGHVAVVRLLLDNGADVDSKKSHGQTPLFQAAGNGHADVVKLLLNKGADVDSKNAYGQTPLWIAVRKRYVAVIEQLIEKGADIESRDEDGNTPLIFAAKEGLSDLFKFLLEAGADTESRDYNGRTSLSWADGRFSSDLEIAELLLQADADLESRDKDGRSPLSWAATEFDHYGSKVTKFLVERGADIESRDQNGRTPLSWAAGEGGTGIVSFLLEKGADTETKDNDGRTPLSWALMGEENTHMEDVVTLLLKAGCEFE